VAGIWTAGGKADEMAVGGGPNLRLAGRDFCLARRQLVVESGTGVKAGERAKE